MRLAQLSETSGVSTATIKYYLREGLLEPGDRVTATQMDYGAGHVQRLRLIRALLEVGGLSIAAVRNVLAVTEGADVRLKDLEQAAQEPLSTRASLQRTEVASDAAVSEILALAERWGWAVSPDSPAIATAAEALETLRRLGQTGVANQIDEYARSAEIAAATDVKAAHCDGGFKGTEALIVGNVLGDLLLASLRRIAQIHRLREGQHTGSCCSEAADRTDAGQA
ncbi:MerR family transcriptional regulator [Streptomyces sp. DSM 118148]|uniref:MerR family transcriptional regulator n=1 Tax=Streptomyces sp. DSM 118148 TaxID=3448667 RepID=UPI00403FFD4D